MKLIIELDEDRYDKNYLLVKNGMGDDVHRAVANGTPIPDNATVCDIEQIRTEIENMRNKVKPLDDFSDRGMYADGKNCRLRLCFADYRQLHEGRKQMTKAELNELVERLICIKDTNDLTRDERDTLSEACNVIYHNINLLSEDGE